MERSRLSLTACLIVAVAAAFLAAYFYVTLDVRRTPLPVMAVLVGGSALTAVAGLIAARASAPVRGNFLLATISALFALYLIEVIFLAFPPLQLMIGEWIGTEDSRSKTQVIRDMRAEGRQAFGNFIPRVGAFLPSGTGGGAPDLVALGSMAGTTAVVCNEAGRWLVFEADERGFNNPPGLWAAAQASVGGADILALGDSFVEGDCVSPSMNIPGRLRATHPLTINLGVMGNGPLLQLGGLVEYGPVLRPRTVLWFFFEGNDLGDLQAELRSPVLRRYLDSDFRQVLVARQDEIDRHLRPILDATFAAGADGEARKTAVRALIDTLLLRRLRHALRADRVVSSEVTTAPLEQGTGSLDDLLQVLRRAQATADTWSGRVVFVYLPGWASVSSGNQPNTLHEEVLAAVRGLNLPVVDLYTVFRAQTDPGRTLFRFAGSHYNEAGYGLVAETIQKAGVLPAAAAPTGR